MIARCYKFNDRKPSLKRGLTAFYFEDSLLLLLLVRDKLIERHLKAARKFITQPPFSTSIGLHATQNNNDIVIFPYYYLDKYISVHCSNVHQKAKIMQIIAFWYE